MLGKGSILTVFGFILAFSSYQMNMSRNVLATSQNVIDQFLLTQVYQASASGMNIAINRVWSTNSTSDTFLVTFPPCSCLARISPVNSDTVRIRVKAWGYRYDEELNARYRYSDSIDAVFANNVPISKYFWFTDDEQGVYWITGDSVWGPVHTNGVINTSGSPVFHNKVTAGMGISPDPTASTAQFLGGWEIGIMNSIPTDLSNITDAANTGNAGQPVNTRCIYNTEVTFDFQADGSVYRTVQGTPTDTVMFSSIAPTNAVYSTADIHVKGVFNGRATLLTTGNIWIDDDLVYSDNPLTNPNSNDLLGLVATNNIYVTDNAPNQTDVNLQACVMAVNGSFKAQNYGSRPLSGHLNVTGSIVQKLRGAVGTFSGGIIQTGFQKRYRFDSRLSTISPPNYPFLKSLSLISWWE